MSRTVTAILIGALVAIGLALLLAPLACMAMMGMGSGMMAPGAMAPGSGGMPGMPMMMWLPWLLILAGLAALVVAATRVGRADGRRETDDPLEILRRRYARGEIGRDEYETMRADFGEGSRQP